LAVLEEIDVTFSSTDAQAKVKDMLLTTGFCLGFEDGEDYGNFSLDLNHSINSKYSALVSNQKQFKGWIFWTAMHKLLISFSNCLERFSPP